MLTNFIGWRSREAIHLFASGSTTCRRHYYGSSTGPGADHGSLLLCPDRPTTDCFVGFLSTAAGLPLGVWSAAGAGGRRCGNTGAPGWARVGLPLLWVGLTAVLVHLPWNLQRRFLEGIQVPLGLLAGVGLAQITDRRLQIARGKRLAQAAVVALAAMSNLYLTAGLTLAAANRSPAFFWPADFLAGVDWLRDHSAWDEAVLAAFETGNLIPARIGHGWCWAIGWRRWTLRGKRRRWLASSLPTRPMMCGGLC